MKQLQQVEGIRHVGPDMYDEIMNVTNPNDPYFRNGTQWALNGVNGINAPGAWGITTGSRAVRVGIIDTGIAQHDDFLHIVRDQHGNEIRRYTNVDFNSGGDFVNMVWQTYPYFAIVPGPLVPDSNGHGTMSASVVGAMGNNGLGVSGVAQQVTLVPMQTGYGASHGTAARVRAITYARNLWDTDQRISILNHSIGGFGTNMYVLEAATQFPGLFVWSAGNSGYDLDNTSQFPNMRYFRPPHATNIISVGAHNRDGGRSVWASHSCGIGCLWGLLCDGPFDGSSNFGRTSVDIFAPGGQGTGQNNQNVRVAHLNNGFSWYNGTSSSAPHVAGVAALMIAANPILGNAPHMVRNIIISFAEEISCYYITNHSVSGGRLNAYRPVSFAMEITDIPFAGGNGTPSSPFLLSNAQHLSNIRYFPSSHFRLANNIDLAGHIWSPIPYLGVNGNLDGNGMTIYNLTLNPTVTGPETFIGLFMDNQGWISNLTIRNVSMNHGRDDSTIFSHVGAIAGQNNRTGNIHNVSVTGAMTVHRVFSSLGGIVGTNRGIIRGANFGDHQHTGYLYGTGDIGGIAGLHIEGALIESSFTINSTIFHTAVVLPDRAVGGIAGRVSSATIRHTVVHDTLVGNWGVESFPGLAPQMGMVVGVLHGTLSNPGILFASNHSGWIFLDVGLLSGPLWQNEQTFIGRYNSPGPFWFMVGNTLGVVSIL